MLVIRPLNTLVVPLPPFPPFEGVGATTGVGDVVPLPPFPQFEGVGATTGVGGALLVGTGVWGWSRSTK